MSDTPQQPQPQDPARELQREIYYQAVFELRGMMPPPPDENPETLARRDRVAIARIAAMAPANADEAILAARYVGASAQASKCLRLAVHHAADPVVAAQNRAWSNSLDRQARGCRMLLLRVQADRRKQEANDAIRDSNAWTEHAARGLMTEALETMPPPPPAAPPPPPVPARPRPWAECSPEEQRIQTAAARWAVVHPARVRLIRQHGGVPPDCGFEPPEPEVVHAIVTGDDKYLRQADTCEAAAA